MRGSKTKGPGAATPAGKHTPSGLNLLAKPVGLNVAPPSSPVPPPSPPINPAPPGGARREARQRQAAAAKSEEGSSEKANAGDAQGRIDPVDAPNQSMRRLDQGKGPLAFTALADRHQPSAWARAAVYWRAHADGAPPGLYMARGKTEAPTRTAATGAGLGTNSNMATTVMDFDAPLGRRVASS